MDNFDSPPLVMDAVSAISRTKMQVCAHVVRTITPWRASGELLRLLVQNKKILGGKMTTNLTGNRKDERVPTHTETY